MFRRISTLFHSAAEVFTNFTDTKEEFSSHWNAINYNLFDENNNNIDNIELTDIAMHLNEMVEILSKEEQNSRGETGICMEFLLNNKILDTLLSLGRADCPSGMKKETLIFFTKILSKVEQPILTYLSVHKSMQMLVKCCVGSIDTEIYEINFLSVLAQRIKKRPHVCRLFIEDALNPSSVSTNRISRTVSDTEIQKSTSVNNPRFPLINSLIELSRSKNGDVMINAHRSLLVCVSFDDELVSSIIAFHTALCHLLAAHVQMYFQVLPKNLPETANVWEQFSDWSEPLSIKSPQHLPVNQQLQKYLAWLTFCNDISLEGSYEIAAVFARQLRNRFLQPTLFLRLLSEQGHNLHTTLSLFTTILYRLERPIVIDVISHWLLNSNCNLRIKMIGLISSTHSSISLLALKLFSLLLKKCCYQAIHSLVIDSLAFMSYHQDSEVGIENIKMDSKLLMRQDSEWFIKLFPANLQTSQVLIGDTDFQRYINDAHTQTGISAIQYSNSQSEFMRPETQDILNSIKLPSQPTEKRVLSQSESAQNSPNRSNNKDVYPMKSSLKTESSRNNSVTIEANLTDQSDSKNLQTTNLANNFDKVDGVILPTNTILEGASQSKSVECPSDTKIDIVDQSKINQNQKILSNGTQEESNASLYNNSQNVVPIIEKTNSIVENSSQSLIISSDSKEEISNHMKKSPKMANGTQEDDLDINRSDSMKNLSGLKISENNQLMFPNLTRQPDFINALFDRMAQIFEQPKEINLYVSEILSQIAMHPSPFIYNLLLSHLPQKNHRTLTHILQILVGNLKQEFLDNLTLDIWLLEVRKNLCGLSTASLIGTPSTNIELLEGAIVLEEFLKEMAAICFVRHSNSILPN